MSTSQSLSKCLTAARLLVVGLTVGACAPELNAACDGEADCPTGAGCFAGRCAVSGDAASLGSDATRDAQGPETGDAVVAADRGASGRDTGLLDAQPVDARGVGPDGVAADARVTAGDGASAVDASQSGLDGPHGPAPDAVLPLMDASQPALDAAGPAPDAVVHAPDAGVHPQDAALPSPDGCVPRPETCDGLDEDCDGRIDEIEGAPLSGPCYTGRVGTVNVGTCHAGVALCIDGGFGDCLDERPPQPEICDGLDNDCNGRADDSPLSEGALCRVGVGGCTREGTYACDVESGALVCSAQAGPRANEQCNGLDDDCNGIVDDAEGRGTICFAGRGACRNEGIIECTREGQRCSVDPLPGGPEVCNGIDDDCDDVIDDVPEVNEACVTGLGACRAQGLRVCNVPEPEPICRVDAPAPTEERCDDFDHNCNGLLRDVPNAQTAAHVPYALLATFNGDCGRVAGLAGPACNAAIHQYCAVQGCWGSGFGPTFADNVEAEVVCLHAGTTVVPSSVARLTAANPNCNSSESLGGIFCNAAIDALCVQSGFAGGYGPVGTSPNRDLSYVCLSAPLAVARELVSWQEISQRHPNCNAGAQAGGPCLYAAHQSCLARGFYAGYGPVQVDLNNAVVLCINR